METEISVPEDQTWLYDPSGDQYNATDLGIGWEKFSPSL